ncbi:hypothetical protein GCM10010172_00640 [Paractinoplanes ferrugineus]|uniref:Uncharacterized protein n=1 Tax=Paractinoplanes ferrugineus TaxID=113564 RepID=A0A919JB43_9ACTN|nr:DUF6232 family protein [Actinoplanes ferrugineus]GIE13911.1 hypothetical protein Afe05nite_57510 [Actinoplanes ferrugineus]
MRLYYRGREAVVTSELFVRRQTSPRQFAIRELQNVRIAVPGGLVEALFRSQLSTREWALWADYRGRPVALYSSPDERVFNQVVRALRRALEEVEPWDLQAA